MKIAVTPGNPNYILILVDTETGEEFRLETVEECTDHYADSSRPPHRPFGLTWNKDHIFVANRTNLLIYNSDLKLVDVRRYLLDQNGHQISVYGEQLISTMTTKNCIKFIDLKDFSYKLWHPKFGYFPFKRGTGNYHINSVLVSDQDIYVMIHNGDKESKIIVGDKVIKTGHHKCHNIYLDKDVIGFIATKEKRVVIGDKVITHPAWETKFIRGLAGDDKQLAVGASNFRLERKDRPTGDSFVSVIKDGEVIKDYVIKNSGDINDLRRIDGPDFCHHNPHPFPYSKF